LNHPEIAVA
jgi:hypothetical protein